MVFWRGTKAMQCTTTIKQGKHASEHDPVVLATATVDRNFS